MAAESEGGVRPGAVPRRARSTVVALALSAAVSAALVGGCGGRSATTTPPGAVVATSPAAAAPTATDDGEYTGACPTEGNTRRFAKTRFALHAGLALGAFHRYIYKPLRAGGFKEGAEKRKRTFVKAAVAGAFALHELKVAKRFAQANPTLCKAVEGVTGKFQSLTDKLKGGTATEADLAGSKNSIDSLQQDAAKRGFEFKEQPVTVPGAG
ncbi:hypothetical protein Skr01_59500 [Sphaerisporangium krabiense]|uniref:Uncharacterized protein n=1 Tax=Sphaerisporangium krabiense TaxID=763782 RepID=A0A7W9DTU2_9ACTN|nr:hypothetical protein [Sphaerisporangium krabiense]MBB5630983.1 hypothetical protein [Sphaerisporangium krabiense]GII65865.1 hypothetical protein Skr01_59500 [Sphaerisporangium krabiense]